MTRSKLLTVESPVQPTSLANLDDLLLYVHKLTCSISSCKNDISFNFNDKDLLKFHHENSCLYVDKYLLTAKPQKQTTLLFKDHDLDPKKYLAFLGHKGKNRFWINYCYDQHYDSDLSDVSELIIPNVKGGSWNPYVKFCNAKRSGFNQLSRIMDLVGIRPDIDVWDYKNKPLFHELTLTFPHHVSEKLLDPSLRKATIKTAWNCLSFFKDLLKNHFVGVLSDHDIGLNVSLHEWSSSVPLLPQLHFHGLFPHWSYKKITKDYRNDLEALIEDKYCQIDDCIEDGEIINFPLVEKLKDEISSDLQQFLDFNVLRYDHTVEIKKKNGVTSLKDYPLSYKSIRILWTHAVKTFFEEAPPPEYYLDGQLYDVHVKPIPIKQKNKLLHSLVYKSRPPLVDLDRFFSKLDGLLFKNKDGDLDLDLRELFTYLHQKISYFEKLELFDQVKVWTSKLAKFEALYSQYDKSHFLEWIQYLVFHRSSRSTRSLGFLRTLTRYRVESKQHKKIPSIMCCPVCGRNSIKGVGVNKISWDHPVIYHRNSKFYLFEAVAGPPPPDSLYCYQ